jgi:hypothetical protein
VIPDGLDIDDAAGGLVFDAPCPVAGVHGRSPDGVWRAAKPVVVVR